MKWLLVTNRRITTFSLPSSGIPRTGLLALFEISDYRYKLKIISLSFQQSSVIFMATASTDGSNYVAVQVRKSVTPQQEA